MNKKFTWRRVLEVAKPSEEQLPVLREAFEKAWKENKNARKRARRARA